MTDYTSLKLYELKDLCKKRGLDAKGNKQALIDRLSGEVSMESDQVEVIEMDLTNESAQEEQIINVEVERVVVNTTEEYDGRESMLRATWLTENRLNKLYNALSEILAGKASFEFDVESKTINFSGGPRVAECMTLCAPDNAILMAARRFTARAFPGKNRLNSVI